jgi:hypothetical protein
LPSAVTYGAAAATEGFMAPPMVYFVGGFNLNSLASTVQAYNLGNGSWSTCASMPTTRAYLDVVDLNDVLYAIGGSDGSNWLSTVDQYIPLGYGTSAPQIQVTSPENKTYSKVTLSYTVNRNTIWTGYSIDNERNVTLNGNIELFNLTQGEHNLILYANDSFGNMGFSNKVYFSVDSLPPQIVIIVPENRSYGSTDIQLAFNLSRNATYLAYSLDGQGTVTIAGNVTLPALSNGSHRLTIYVTDDLGNNGSKTVYFEIAPFPTFTVVGIAASVTIALAAGYILLPKKKPGEKKQIRRF